MYIQYPDLTELASYELYKNVNLNIRTEFAFFTAMSKHSANKQIATNVTILEDMGFKRLTSMNNWWPSHWDDGRVIDFWWKRYEKNTKPVENAFRQVWGGREYPWLKGLIAATGCGFKIGHSPLRQNLYYRFFSLLRLTKKPTALSIKWLEKYNFKKIDEGQMAEYWLNGWDYDKYSLKMEMDYWTKHDPNRKLQAKPERGMYW